MSYQINHFNGDPLTVVIDGVIDDTLDLRLIGKNSAGYGDAQNENFVYLLEHFASASVPKKAIKGQLWYDSTATSNRLKLYDGNSNWSQVATIVLDNVSAAGRSEGDLLWNSEEQKLYVFSNGGYSFVGPQRIPGYNKTELESTLVKDISNADKPVIKAITNGEVVYIISANDDFQLATNLITGFDWVRKGITLSSSTKLTGIATHADFLVDKVPDDFIYSAHPQFAVLAEFADVGFTIGNELSIFNDATVPTIQATGATLQFKLGTDSPLVLSTTDVLPGTDGVSDLGASTHKWNNLYANYVYSTSAQADAIKVDNVYRTTDVNSSANSVVVRDANSNINSTTFTGALVGNAATTTKFITARTINGVSFDGTANIVITARTPATINPGTDIIGTPFDGGSDVTWSIDSSSLAMSNKLVKRDNNGNFNATLITSNLKGNIISSITNTAIVDTSATTTIFTGNLVGNADSATKLQTARTINNVSFDGTSNIVIADSTKVAKAGDTMTGFLTLNANPTSSMHASTKQYVDQSISTLDSAKVAKAGDTMTGFLTLNANPTSSMHASTKQYVDQSISTLDSAKVAKAGDTMTGFLTLNANPTSSMHAATKAYVDAYGCPTGAILMWSGAINTIPSGWALCNGQTVNGKVTPNLVDRFIVAAGNAYAPSSTGGSTSATTNTQGNHSHSGSVGSTALNVAQVPAHQHTFTDVYAIVGDAELGGSTAPTHDRNGTYIYPSFYAGNASDGDYDNGAYGFPSITGMAGSGQGHSHSVGADGSHAHSVSITPPYYALAYIMKVI